MKNLLSCTKTFILLLVITVISLGFYAYMLARPISYGMDYHNKTVYEGRVIEGIKKFYSGGTMVNRISNFDEGMKLRYYYKDGYIFFTLAEREEEYNEEVALINANFDEAINTPFYAGEIDAFKLVAAEADGYSTIYICTSAINFAIAGGVVELILIGLIFASLIIRKKAKCKTI